MSESREENVYPYPYWLQRWNRERSHETGLFSRKYIRALISDFGPVPDSPVAYKFVYGISDCPPIHVESTFTREFALLARLNGAAEMFESRETYRRGQPTLRSAHDRFSKVYESASKLLEALEVSPEGAIQHTEYTDMFLAVCLPGESDEKSRRLYEGLHGNSERNRRDLHEAIISVRRLRVWAAKASRESGEYLRRGGGTPKKLAGYYPRDEFILQVIDAWCNIFSARATISWNEGTNDSGSQLLQFAERVMRRVPRMQLATGDALKKLLIKARRDFPRFCTERDAEFERTQDAYERRHLRRMKILD